MRPRRGSNGRPVSLDISSPDKPQLRPTFSAIRIATSTSPRYTPHGAPLEISARHRSIADRARPFAGMTRQAGLFPTSSTPIAPTTSSVRIERHALAPWAPSPRCRPASTRRSRPCRRSGPRRPPCDRREGPPPRAGQGSTFRQAGGVCNISQRQSGARGRPGEARSAPWCQENVWGAMELILCLLSGGR